MSLSGNSDQTPRHTPSSSSSLSLLLLCFPLLSSLPPPPPSSSSLNHLRLLAAKEGVALQPFRLSVAGNIAEHLIIVGVNSAVGHSVRGSRDRDRK